MEILKTEKKSDGVNEKTFLIVHHTGSPNYEAMKKLLSGNLNDIRNVSVHYVVGQLGEVAKIGVHSDILWHAGMGKVTNTNDEINMNYQCIGVEICSDGYIFSEIQKKTVDKLILEICDTENISKENVLRHADISGYRGKWDCGPNFYEGFATFPDYINYIFKNNMTEQEEKDMKIKTTFQALCSSSWYSASPELRKLIEDTKNNFEQM